MFFYELLDISF